MGFRSTAVVFGAAIAAYGVVLLFAGEIRPAFSAWLVGGGSILLVTWARGFPAREWLTTAMLFVGIALIGSPLFALVVLAAALGFQLWLSRRMHSRMSTEFERLDAGEAMPGAEDAVAAFESAGFRPSGAYATQVPRLRGTRRVVVSVLTGPEGDRFAIATDRIGEVVSRFGDRSLLTINTGQASLPASMLRQVIARGGPAELAAAHQKALDLLAERGLQPDRLAGDDDALEAAFELERSALAYATGAGFGKGLMMGMTSDPVLRDDKRTRRRIDDWLADLKPQERQMRSTPWTLCVGGAGAGRLAGVLRVDARPLARRLAALPARLGCGAARERGAPSAPAQSALRRPPTRLSCGTKRTDPHRRDRAAAREPRS